MKRILTLVLAAALLCAPAYASIRFGQGTKTVTSAGAPLAILASAQDVTSLTICGDSGNTGKIAVAQSPVALAGSQQGVILSPGGCVSIEGIGSSISTFDASTFKVDSTVSGEKASFFWVLES